MKLVLGGEIDQLRSIYEQYQLWHRSPSDGAIVMRVNNRFLVSQTNTDKTVMNSQNFSLVMKYSLGENSLTYVGKKLPTSDADLIMVLDQLKSYRLLVHFHKNEITRGSQFEGYMTSDEIEYGQFQSALKILSELQKQNSNWLILKEHGVVWLSNSVEEFQEFLVDKLSLAG